MIREKKPISTNDTSTGANAPATAADVAMKEDAVITTT